MIAKYDVIILAKVSLRRDGVEVSDCSRGVLMTNRVIGRLYRRQKLPMLPLMAIQLHTRHRHMFGCIQSMSSAYRADCFCTAHTVYARCNGIGVGAKIGDRRVGSG